MSLFSEMLADDARNVFATTDEFGESGTYKPLGGTSFTESMMVNRMPPEVPGEAGIVRNFHMTVFLPVSTNVTSINVNGDVVTIPTNIGDTASDHPVVEILSQDAGGWTLLVR